LTCRCLWLGQFPGQRRSPTLPAHKPLHSLNLVLDWDSIVFEKGRGKLEAYVSNCGYADGLAQTKIESIKFCACGGCWSAIVEGQCFKQGRYPADKSTHVHSVNSRLGHDHALGCTCKTRLPEAQCLTPSLHRRRDVSPRPASSARARRPALHRRHWTPACNMLRGHC
jgi:hypothetical protein